MMMEASMRMMQPKEVRPPTPGELTGFKKNLEEHYLKESRQVRVPSALSKTQKLDPVKLNPKKIRLGGKPLKLRVKPKKEPEVYGISIKFLEKEALADLKQPEPEVEERPHTSSHID
jgi:hypothetical protein